MLREDASKCVLWTFQDTLSPSRLFHRAVFDTSRGAIATLNFVRVIGAYPRAWECDDNFLYNHFLAHYLPTLAKEFENIDTDFAPYYKNLFNWLFNLTPSIQIHEESNNKNLVFSSYADTRVFEKEKSVSKVISERRKSESTKEGNTQKEQGSKELNQNSTDLQINTKCSCSSTGILPETPKTYKSRFTSSEKDLSAMEFSNFNNLLTLMDDEEADLEVCEKALIVLVELDKTFQFCKLREELFEWKSESRSLRKLKGGDLTPTRLVSHEST